MALKVNSKIPLPHPEETKPSLYIYEVAGALAALPETSRKILTVAEPRERSLAKFNSSLPDITRQPLPRSLRDKFSDNPVEVAMCLACGFLLLSTMLPVVPLALLGLVSLSFIVVAIFGVILSHKRFKKRTLAVERENQERVEKCWREFAGGSFDSAPATPCDGFEILRADKRNIVEGDKVEVEFFPSVVCFNNYNGWRYRSIEDKDPITPGEDPRLDSELLLQASLIPGYDIADIEEIASLPSRFDSEEFDLLAEGWADYCGAIDKINERRWTRLQEAEITANFQKEIVSEKLGTLELLPAHKS